MIFCAPQTARRGLGYLHQPILSVFKKSHSRIEKLGMYPPIWRNSWKWKPGGMLKTVNSSFSDKRRCHAWLTSQLNVKVRWAMAH